MWVAEVGLISAWGIKLDLISVSGSEVTWFLCGGRKMLGFSAWIESNLVFVSGHRNWLRFTIGIEIDLFFLRRGEIDFVRAKIGLSLVWSIDLVLGGRPRLTWFWDAGRISLGLCVSIEIDLVWCGRSKLTWFQHRGSILYKPNKTGPGFKRLTESLSVLSAINKQKRSGVLIPPKSYSRLFWNA